MELISSEELIEGMVIAKPIISEKTGQEILKEGVKLKENIIEAIKKRGIKEVYVRDLFTMDFDPIDTIIRDLKKGYKREISKFAPCMKSAGLSDLIVEASEKAQTIAPKIYENEKIAKICLEMKIVDQDFLNHSITVSSLAMVISFLKGTFITDCILYDICFCNNILYCNFSSKIIFNICLYRNIKVSFSF